MTAKFSYRITSILLFLFGQAVFAQSKPAKLKLLMKSYHQYNMFEGAVLVAENGKIIYKDAFGLANREWNIPNTVDTKFMIGSISKSLTATLTLILVQKGLLDLNNPIDKYLPEFQNKPAAKVTIKQLLSHTSGMPNYDIMKDFFPRISRQNFTRQDYMKIYADSALAFPAGTKYWYRSWGYFTLGYLIEKVTGKSYEQAMKDEIFGRLNMNNSGSYSHTKVIANRASGYDYGFGDFTSADFRDQSNTMGTGDIYSTVEDLYKFHMGIAANTILNKRLTEEMLSPGMRPAQYGYGWFNQNFKYAETDSVKANYHLGSTEGFMAFYLREPGTNNLVVLLSNCAPFDFFGMTKNILRVLHNKPVKLKQPLHKIMETLIGKPGAEKAVQQYQLLKRDTSNYSADWLQLYFLGEKLLSLKRYDEARIIAENNIKEFPEKELNNLSLANIYLALGRKEEAAKFYKKTLEINPENEEAKNRLKEISTY